jgi:hypothetical protein
MTRNLSAVGRLLAQTVQRPPAAALAVEHVEEAELCDAAEGQARSVSKTTSFSW